MNRGQLMKILMWVCAAILVCAVVFNMTGLFGGSPFGYANADKYTAGETAIRETVRNLDIEWVNGKVNLETHGGDTVELKESSDKVIGEDLKMRWWMDGDTLRVRYAKSGLRLSWNQEKTLTVMLPENSAFGDVSISATSADLNIPELRAEKLNLEVTSGDILAAAEARQISAGSTSGDMTLRISGEAESVTAGSTSGRITVEADRAGSVKMSSTSGGGSLTVKKAGKVEIGSTSGSISVEAEEAEQVKLGSTSGSAHAALAKFGSLKIDSTSGDVQVMLKDEPGFTAKIDTTSGKIDYSLPLSRQGNEYVCGDGSGRVEIGTTSGDVRLDAAK